MNSKWEYKLSKLRRVGTSVILSAISVFHLVAPLSCRINSERTLRMPLLEQNTANRSNQHQPNIDRCRFEGRQLFMIESNGYSWSINVLRPSEQVIRMRCSSRGVMIITNSRLITVPYRQLPISLSPPITPITTLISLAYTSTSLAEPIDQGIRRIYLSDERTYFLTAENTLFVFSPYVAWSNFTFQHIPCEMSHANMIEQNSVLIIGPVSCDAPRLRQIIALSLIRRRFQTVDLPNNIGEGSFMYQNSHGLYIGLNKQEGVEIRIDKYSEQVSINY